MLSRRLNKNVSPSNMALPMQCLNTKQHRPICVDADGQAYGRFSSMQDVSIAANQLRVAVETYRSTLQRVGGPVWTHHASQLRDLQAYSMECETVVDRERRRLNELTRAIESSHSTSNDPVAHCAFREEDV